MFLTDVLPTIYTSLAPAHYTAYFAPNRAIISVIQAQVFLPESR
jgi:hypothetical protein